ncbi:MAG TPA: radical SAM protein [Acidimicrobiales bacterium]|nr:radical SAM protein [Acidimicrobiales bacterium]
MATRDARPRIPLRWHLAEEDDEGTLFPDETAVTRHVGTGEFRGMEFLHVNARSIINPVPAASRMSFRYTINPYRGCSHACNYCFARPTHDYLGLNIGEDFERRIVVKVNTVERLRAELRAPKWAGEHIAMGTNTDPYQLAEGKYHLTQGVIRTLTDARNPFSILTKSTLILRDLDLLVSAARRTSVHLNFSIGTLDRDVWKLTEPGTPPPERRLTAVRRFNDAGIPCGVLVAPVLPGLSDSDEQVQAVVEACVDAGAISVAAIPLHLRPGVREHFMGWLATARPDLVPLYERRFRRGSYQPKAEQARLAALVAGVLKKKGTGTRQVRRYIEDLDDLIGSGTEAGSAGPGGADTVAPSSGAATRPAAARAASRSAPTRTTPARPVGEQLRLL